MSFCTFCIILTLWGVGDFLLITWSIVNAPILAILAALFASPIPMAIAGWVEGGWQRVREVFCFRTQFWSFLIADPILAFCIGIISLGWEGLSLDMFTIIWMAAALLVGMCWSVYFHSNEWKSDAYNHDPDILRSPTKEVHDRLAYTLLPYAVLQVVPPLVAGRLWVASSLVGAAVWVTCCVFDTKRQHRGEIDYTLVHRPYMYKPNIVTEMLGLLCSLVFLAILLLEWIKSIKRREGKM